MFRTALAACVALLTSLTTPAVAADKPDLAIYGALPKIEEVVISPDGSKLAVVTTDGEQRYLTVRKTEGGGIAGVALKATKLRSVMWAGEEHVVLVVSQASQGMTLVGPPREYFMASDFNITTNILRPLLDGAKKTSSKIGVEETFNIIVGPPQVRMVKGDPVVFLEGVRYLRGTAADTLYATNLRTGTLRLAENTPRYGTNGWLVDIDGKPIAQTTYDTKSGRGTLLVKAGANWKKVDEADSPTGAYGISGLGRDGKSVLVWRRADDDVLREYTRNGGREALPDDLAFDGLIHDPYSARLLGGYTLDGDELRYTFFNPAVQSAWYAAIKPFRDARVSLKSWSRDWSRVIVQVDAPTEGPAYYLIDLKTGKGWFQSRVYESVKPEAISPVRPIKYKAADGLEISGYLTLPRERQPTNLPLIVLAHGGPEGRDAPGFDWWSQALASRGYAVLQANFRGSAGFGKDFVKAGYGEWGKKMQTDLSDGVRDLARQGVIDPKRVCIMGASYGGYAALAGATLDKGVYRCAVSVDGPSDLNLVRQEVVSPKEVCMSTIGETPCPKSGAGPVNPGRMLSANLEDHGARSSTSPRYWLRFMGADKKADLDALSPVKLANRVDVPVLLIHGTDDTIVPFAQSQIMADALKKAGKPVSLVALKGEDHWFSRGESRVKMLTEAVAFVEKNNPPD
ncbi:S9 family peptidase [Caulobacter sp. FWC2]|uniref:alpha/beta hydrolase family protein n=1 Tax=Caulobacter sp. FWC2 TaxID=69664 RepID=UPI000C1502DF|nr:S9 family peptidase [Caulobacter sp. FWC2]PIB93380.1 peptidase S9 [Caulobacter sp. FWC2]